MHYSDILKSELLRRKQKNPRYSLRRFAYHLNLDCGHLSRLLKGKAKLSPNLARRVLSSPGLGVEDRQALIEAILQELKQDLTAATHSTE